MKSFATLYKKLDSTNKDKEKLDILTSHLSQADPRNAAWIVFFLSGQKIERSTTLTDLKKWCRQETDTPKWLYKECYSAVGDTAETITLLLDQDKPANETLWKVMKDFTRAQKQDSFIQEMFIKKHWRRYGYYETLVFNKIITRAFRIGVNKTTVVKALATLSKVDEQTIKQRMMGDVKPTLEFYKSLLKEKGEDEHKKSPYPFFLATKLEEDDVGDETDWMAEYKWDGIRAQTVMREEIAIWSRRGDLITKSFPRLENDAGKQGIVIDGEIVVKQNEEVKPFNRLQQRLGKKEPEKSLLDNHPVTFIAYDLLEKDGEDIRQKPLQQRRKLLEDVIASLPDRYEISKEIPFETWEELENIQQNSREVNAEGVMIKKKKSPYKSGRKKGYWYKWKLPPHTIDTVLMYAKPGRGRRANLYTDYTLGVWDDEDLIPVAKAYSGLTDEQLEEMTKWIKKNTVDKYGPVREVKKAQVFEIAFESMRESNRHKSEISLRFPRIKRWRKDKPADEAETLERTKEYLNP